MARRNMPSGLQHIATKRPVPSARHTKTKTGAHCLRMCISTTPGEPPRRSGHRCGASASVSTRPIEWLGRSMPNSALKVATMSTGSE